MQPSYSSTAHTSRQGTLAAFGAFCIWGFMPLFWYLLSRIPPAEIVSVRVVWVFFFLATYLIYKERLGSTLRVLKHKKQTLALFCSAGILSLNWLLYIWAVNSGYVLEASLGYYINPLINIFLGRLVFKDRISPIAALAILLAVIGVLYQIVTLGTLPFIALGLGVSFAIYGLIRKVILVEALDGLFIETILFLPAALGYFIWLACTGQSALVSQGPLSLWLYSACLGPLTAIPMLWFTYGARRISLTTLGLLQYTAPSIMFLLGYFIFQESLQASQLITFACIWTALGLYSWEGLRNHAKRRRAGKANNPTPPSPSDAQ